MIYIITLFPAHLQACYRAYYMQIPVRFFGFGWLQFTVLLIPGRTRKRRFLGDGQVQTAAVSAQHYVTLISTSA